MSRIKHLILVLTMALSHFAYAENSKDIGQYIVHYHAIPTASLSKKVATSYGITRSKNRSMLNISVLKKLAGENKAVTASITATATNLSNQIKNLDMREIREQSAIYYIAEFSISNEEVLRFTLNISPENQPSQTIQFKKQFFTQ